MRRSISSTKRSAFRHAALLGFFIVPHAQAAISLNVLTACDDIAQLYNSLRSTTSAFPSDCRQARTPLEKALVTRTHLDSSKLCFQEPGIRFLDRFTCFRSFAPQGAALTCFRAASDADIKTYKREYDEKFKARVTSYLAAASACSVSNHDSSPSQPTTFPPLLNFVSRFDFGFITPLGQAQPPDSSVVHGYATTDPTLVGDAPTALEFVYVLTGMPPYGADYQFEIIGKWKVTIDPATLTTEGFNAEAKKSRAPIWMTTRAFSFKQNTTVATALSSKISNLTKLQGAIAHSLGYEGFDTMPDDELKAYTGMTPRQMVEKVTRDTVPFGQSRNAPVKLVENFKFLMNSKRPRCAKDSKGAIGAFVMASEPEDGVASDFGGVAVMIIGLGACSRTTITSTREYMDGLVEVVRDEVRTQLASM
jgi:hypothetical protein